MALKKPGELFEKKVKVETPVKVEEVHRQIDSVSSSFANSLTEAIDKNLNLLSEEYSEKLNKFNHKIDSLKEEINIKLNGLEKTNQSLKGEIGVVEERQSRININQLKEEVISEIRKLEFKIETVKEAYQEIINEGLLNEPPSTDNEDPLTPLDKNYATLDDLNNHYKLFVNRIQKQLSTLGGGGAVNIKDMDDVDLSTAEVNGKVLEYDSTLKKWKGGTGGGSGIGTDNVSTSTLNVVGVSTFNEDVKFIGNNTNMRWDHSTSDLNLFNNTRLEFGDNKDFEIWHGGSHTFMKNSGGDLRIRGDVIKLAREDSSERYIECNVNNAVQIFHNGTERFATTGIGVTVSGQLDSTTLNVTGVSTFSDSLDVEGQLYVASNIRHIGDNDTYIEFTSDRIRLIGGGKALIDATEAGTDSVVINEGSNDLDFRVEGLNDEYQIFSDGGTDRVGIGSAIPRSKLDVRGDVYVGSSQATGVVLTSPNGTEYRLIVADDGTLSTTAV